MQYDPPRAQKKYSQTWEFKALNLRHSLLEQLPARVGHPRAASLEPLALKAAFFSIIPGLGHLFLAQNFKIFLAQFGTFCLLFLSYFFTFGTATGWVLAMLMFSLHQLLMYRSYLRGIRLSEGEPPKFWKGMWISSAMTLLLSVLYTLAFSPLQSHLFYAQRTLGTAVSQGDRYFLWSQKHYEAGDIVVFNRNNYYNHALFGMGMGTLMEKILAGPGDHLTTVNGIPSVNGNPLSPLVRPLEGGLSFPNDLIVPAGSYFILYGEYRTNMQTDWNWFLVDEKGIRGKLVFRYFPSPEVLS